jgi:hypothetical protein
MSEVDRVSNSGLYPALPIADRRSRERPPGSPPEQRPGAEQKHNGNQAQDGGKRPPKSIIDDYA